MTRPASDIDNAALNAYADGQLDEAERRAVEAYLAARPDAAALVAGWQRQNEALTALFPLGADEPLPARLDPYRIAAGMRAERVRRLRNIAAALLLVLIGSGIGWFGRDVVLPGEAASDRLISAAITAHTLYVNEKTHAVEVAAGSPNLMTWLSNRIATPIDAPDLVAQGFSLVGGRLLPGDPEGYAPGPVAQLMYENATAQRVTLYITPALPDRKEASQFSIRDGVEAYYWADASVTCTLVGALPEDDMKLLGKQVFAQLTRKSDSSWNAAG
jgi:anti-sigma factor RsiW